MKTVKQLILRFLFVGELVCFSWFYCFGYQGLSSVWHLEQENKQVEQSNALLQQENDALAVQIKEWDEHPFGKEEFARTKLHMARPGDQIFIIPD